MSELEKMVWDLAEPICMQFDVVLLEVNYKKEKGAKTLEVIIDKELGVSIDDCTNVNQALSEKLDEVDPIEENYTLVVSSAGCEREIKTDSELQKALGKYIHIKTYEKITLDKFQTKDLEGDLVSATPEVLTLNLKIKGKDKTIEIERKKIAKIRYAIKF